MATYIPLIYFLVVLAWVLLFVFYKYLNDWSLVMLASMFILILGIHILSMGLDGTVDLVSNVFGLVHFGAGAYILVRTGIDTIQKYL